MDTDAPTRNTAHTEAGHEAPAAARAAAIVVALTTLIAIVAIAFALPASRSAPHDVPIGVAGPPVLTTQITDQVGRAAPGAFAVTVYSEAAGLREAILNRDAYGGIVVDQQGPTLLIATGASPAVAAMLGQLGSGMAQATGIPLRTEDLAPPTADDPRGAGLAATALPITLAAILPAIALVLALRREVWTRLAAAFAFAPVAGISVAASLTHVLGSVETNFWGVAAGLTLGIAAALLPILGLGSLFGRAGLAVGAVLALLVGNPLSGIAGAPELLPAGWGAFGQLLPQGATATLLRSTAYFSGAGATSAVVVLTCWAVVGALLVVIAAARQKQ
ncbi:ABC transporter permease [Mycolicibacterium sp. 624]|uniref:ABC transporter permease n=1 Tax=Mycolicibacterium sp. 624 TaxID=3156314 RepID=UPI0033982F80